MAGESRTAPRNPLRDPRDRRLTRIAGPSALVLFGVTGDLAKKKLLPAMYDLAQRGLLPPAFSLVGFGRRDWSCLLYTSPSPRDATLSRMPSSA